MGLNDEIKRILERNGYGLKLVRDTKPLDMRKAKEVFRTIGTSISGREYLITQDNTFTIENVLKWMHCEDGLEAVDPSDRSGRMKGDVKKGIYIGGPTGTGKTLITEIMNIYSELMELKYRFGYEEGIVKYVNVRTDAIVDEYMKTGDIRRFKNARFLMIQDLGAENLEALYMGTRMNVLKNIIESRGDKQDMYTVMTSNYPMSERNIINMYGERISSRLHEMCNYYVLKGTDFRKI